jgi:hypothetical protein
VNITVCGRWIWFTGAFGSRICRAIPQPPEDSRLCTHMRINTNNITSIPLVLNSLTHAHTFKAGLGERSERAIQRSQIAIQRRDTGGGRVKEETKTREQSQQTCLLTCTSASSARAMHKEKFLTRTLCTVFI